jgi:hypothetical protein
MTAIRSPCCGIFLGWWKSVSRAQGHIARRLHAKLIGMSPICGVVFLSNGARYSNRSYLARELVSSEDKFQAAAANYKSCASCTVLPSEADSPVHPSEYSMLMKSDTAEINFKGESWTEL